MLDPCTNTCPTKDHSIDISFRISKCVHSCSDGDLNGNIDPVIRVWNNESNQFFSFDGPSRKLEFTRSLHRHYLLETIDGPRCIYPQEYFNTAELGQEVVQDARMVCSKAPDNCDVVCDVEELNNG